MKKIAYLILAHSDPTQLGMLSKALDKECNDLYIHIDAKQKNIEEFKSKASKNSCFLEHRVNVNWGGISTIDAQNLLLKQGLIHKQNYSHMVFISGSCYPIKNTRLLHQMLTQAPYRQFIKYIDMRESPDYYLKFISQKKFYDPVIPRAKSKPLRLLDKVMRTLLNRINISNDWDQKIVPYHGSQWCALTTECCQYIIDFQNKNPWFREMNKYTFFPDEHYYHTIIGNSEFAEHSTGIQAFKGRGTWQWANLHIISHIFKKWFTTEDWEEIVNSDQYFVRKVRSCDGAELVERINRELLELQNASVDGHIDSTHH